MFQVVLFVSLSAVASLLLKYAGNLKVRQFQKFRKSVAMQTQPSVNVAESQYCKHDKSQQK